MNEFIQIQEEEEKIEVKKIIATCKKCNTSFDVIENGLFSATYLRRYDERVPYEVRLLVICPICGVNSREVFIFKGEDAKKLYLKILSREEPFKFEKNKTPILGYVDGIPVIYAKIEKNGSQCSFYCEYCRKYHRHGIGEGRRLSHCINENSPFKDREYYLVHYADSKIFKLIKGEEK